VNRHRCRRSWDNMSGCTRRCGVLVGERLVFVWKSGHTFACLQLSFHIHHCNFLFLALRELDVQTRDRLGVKLLPLLEILLYSLEILSKLGDLVVQMRAYLGIKLLLLLDILLYRLKILVSLIALLCVIMFVSPVVVSDTKKINA
jgi:hypothetical protein